MALAWDSKLRSHFDKSQYHFALASPPSVRPRLSRDETCNTCIIGGGIAGSAAALKLSQRGHNVIVVEAETISSGASGQNMGFIKPLQHSSADAVRKAYGSFSDTAYKHVRTMTQDVLDMIAAAEIECEMRRGILLPARTGEDLERTKTNVFSLKTEFDDPTVLTVLDAKGVREYVRSDDFVGGVMTDTPHLNPLKLTLGFAEAAEKQGARFFEHTVANDVSAENGRAVVTTEAGYRIRADRVLIATNAYLRGISKHLRQQYLPFYAANVATEPLDASASPIRPGIAVHDLIPGKGHVRMTGQHNCLLFGGKYFTPTDDAKSYQQLSKELRTAFGDRLRDVEIPFHWGGWLALTSTVDIPQLGTLAPNIHFVLGPNLTSAMWHGKAFADFLYDDDGAYREIASIRARPIPMRGAANLALNGIREIAGRL